MIPRMNCKIKLLLTLMVAGVYLLHQDCWNWRKITADKKFDQARAHMNYVVEQGVTPLKHRKIAGLFTTPKLLEALAE